MGKAVLLLGYISFVSTMAAPPDSTFVKTDGTLFTFPGQPYSYIDADSYYVVYLSAEAHDGARGRHKREIDRLPSTAYVCSCTSPSTVRAGLNQSVATFEGIVLSAERVLVNADGGRAKRSRADTPRHRCGTLPSSEVRPRGGSTLSRHPHKLPVSLGADQRARLRAAQHPPERPFRGQLSPECKFRTP